MPRRILRCALDLIKPIFSLADHLCALSRSRRSGAHAFSVPVEYFGRKYQCAQRVCFIREEGNTMQLIPTGAANQKPVPTGDRLATR